MLEALVLCLRPVEAKEQARKVRALRDSLASRRASFLRFNRCRVINRSKELDTLEGDLEPEHVTRESLPVVAVVFDREAALPSGRVDEIHPTVTVLKTR